MRTLLVGISNSKIDICKGSFDNLKIPVHLDTSYSTDHNCGNQCSLKDVAKLEQLQTRVSKYILQDYISDYKSRLISLKILPLMMLYELNDVG